MEATKPQNNSCSLEKNFQKQTTENSDYNFRGYWQVFLLLKGMLYQQLKLNNVTRLVS